MTQHGHRDVTNRQHLLAKPAIIPIHMKEHTKKEGLPHHPPE